MSRVSFLRLSVLSATFFLSVLSAEVLPVSLVAGPQEGSFLFSPIKQFPWLLAQYESLREALTVKDQTVPNCSGVLAQFLTVMDPFLSQCLSERGYAAAQVQAERFARSKLVTAGGYALRKEIALFLEQVKEASYSLCKARECAVKALPNQVKEAPFVYQMAAPGAQVNG